MQAHGRAGRAAGEGWIGDLFVVVVAAAAVVVVVVGVDVVDCWEDDPQFLLPLLLQLPAALQLPSLWNGLESGLLYSDGD